MARALWLAMLASVTDTLAPPRRIPRLLLVDCFDSYTQNVAGWLAEASHARHGGDGPVAAHWPDVVAHDDPALLGALSGDFWPSATTRSCCGDGARGADIPGAAAAAGTYRKIDVGVRDPRGALASPADDAAAACYRELFYGGAGSFWLDGGGSAASRVAVVGDGAGPLGYALTHDARPGGGATTWHGGRAGTTAAPLLETLRAELAKLEGSPSSTQRAARRWRRRSTSLGFVGYLGYEMRRETADYSPASEALPRDRADEPDAAFVFATRAVVVDAWDGAAWILELSKTGAPLDDAWHDRALAVLRDAPAPADAPPADVSVRPRVDGEADGRQIESALASIRRGDSYEICLTTSFGGTVPPRTDPLAVYERLRSGNPAPHSAF
ncbi:4-amino-4-deoxychorismate synthase [Aureococcus anophagefferens]|nr:4-amino-4-deoxychorismate synthase [Aureococcus anophagefferens]